MAESKRSAVLSWLLPAVISFGGVIAGGYISDRGARVNAQQAKLTEIKTQAYIDFANLQARSMSDPDKDVDEYRRGMRQALIRIALFGDLDEIGNIAHFYRNGREPCGAEIDADLKMYAGIREHMLGQSLTDTQKADIISIIYHCDPGLKPKPNPASRP